MLAAVLVAGSSSRTLNTPFAVSTLVPTHHRATNALARVASAKKIRHGIVDHSAHPRRGHRSAICAAILVEPGGYVSMSLAETFRWNTDPDADREAPLGIRDHVARLTRHLVFLVRSAGQWHRCLVVSSRPGSSSAGYARHVWSRSPLLRRQRDQARILDPTASADAEH